MSLIRATSNGPGGVPADTVACYGMDEESGATFTHFNTDGLGIAIGVRGSAHNNGAMVAALATIACVLSAEDTEELRQQLNEWYGRKAVLLEAKHAPAQG